MEPIPPCPATATLRSNEHRGPSRTVSLAAGQAIRIPARWRHRLSDNPADPLWVYGLAWTRSEEVIGRLLTELQPARPFPVAPATGRLHRQLRRWLFLQSRRDPLTDAIGYAGSLSILAELATLAAARFNANSTRSFEPTDDAEARRRVESHLIWLRNHFFEPLKLDDAAAQAGLSRRTFTELVREVCGTSWSRYMTGLRIDHARKLLSQTDRSITSIAFECGFEELSTFYRAYKRLRGPESPGSYRASGSRGQREDVDVD